MKSLRHSVRGTAPSTPEFFKFPKALPLAARIHEGNPVTSAKHYLINFFQRDSEGEESNHG